MLGALLSVVTRPSGAGLPQRVGPRLHAATCFGVALALLAAIVSPVSFVLLCAYGGVRLLIMLLRSLWLLLVFGLIALGSLVFPPLAVLGILLVIWIVVSRLAYLAEHFRIIVDGLVLYLVLGALGLGVGPVAGPAALGSAAVLLTPATAALAVGGVAFAVLVLANLVDLRLRAHYERGYTCSQVHEIATTVPFVLLLLILAIAGVAMDVAVDANVDVAPGDAPPPDVSPPDAPLSAPEPVPDPPGTVEIAGYVRSNPDGIIENNISFEGPRPAGTPDPPGYHGVEAHVRTLPDGIEANNLSYRGAPEAIAAEPALRPPPDPAWGGHGVHAEMAAAALSPPTCPHCRETHDRFRELSTGFLVCQSCGASHRP